jgi:Ni,Fe-hydrogenase I cytochrome b subunit
MPLVNNNLNMELLMPLSPLAVTTWLALVVLGALLGGFFIYLFERGLVKSGFQSWTLLTQTEGELTVPTWRRLRWWILIGFLVLIAGLFTGAALAS